MAIPTWPASLPQELITDGYGQQAPNTIIATQMDVGPGKRRRRTSAGVQPVQGQIVVTEAQLDTLRTFFRTTLGDGALRFRWIDPVTSPNPAGEARMVLDGNNAAFASTPYSAALDITGDITLVARLYPDTWLPDEQTSFLLRWDAGSSFNFRIHNSGDLYLLWRESGAGALLNSRSTVPVADVAAPGQPLWVAVAMDTDDGNGQAIVRFYTRHNGLDWSQLGADRVHPATHLQSTTSRLEVGGERLSGKVYRAQVYSGAGFDLSSGPTGTLVADFNAQDAPDYARGGDSFDSTLTGETWTLHGNASIGDDHPLVISDDMVLDPKLPRPSICLTAMARREVRLQALWRQCR